jgi:hypothetical protein
MIGMVLTCVTDMAIGWCNDRVYSIASPDKPHNFKPAGLSCGFIKVITRLNYGQMRMNNFKLIFPQVSGPSEHILTACCRPKKGMLSFKASSEPI